MSKVILQHDERDCGAACLAMVASYYGLKYPLSRFRELTKTDRTGTNLYGLVDGGTQLGFSCQALEGSPEELMDGINRGEIRFPFIAHTVNPEGLLHYVVVFGLKNGRFFLGDPGKGKRRLSTEAFFDLWTGYIVTYEKTERFQPGNYVRRSFSKFFSLLKGQYHKLAVVLALSLLVSGAGIAGAFVFQVVIDGFQETAVTEIQTEEAGDGHDHDGEEDPGVLAQITEWVSDHSSQFYLVLIFVIGLYLLQAAIQIVRGFLIISVSRCIDVRLSLSYYNHLIGLPVSSIALRQTGEYLSRFSDASAIRNAVSGAALTLMLDSIMVIACGVILYMENAKMFFVALLMIVFYAIVVLIYRGPVERANRSVMENNAVVQSYLKESIDGIETVKIHSADGQVKETTARKFNRFLNAVVKNSLISLSQDTIAGTVEMIGTVIILWIGFALVLGGEITLGSLMTFYVLLSYFTEPIKNLIELQPTIQTAIVAADRLNDILDLQEEEQSSEGEDRLPPAREWTFDHVDFRYGNQELTLKDISLCVKRGERIAIVGESGSGKTTLAKLLIRFYVPENGCISVDGNDISQISLTALRNEIAYVSQDTFLFSDTIRNNLKLGNETISEEEMFRACALSRADEFIRTLPMGYDTPLDEGGTNLSGGQRQRLALARAMMRKPQLLILDEATSNLDTVTEAAIKRTIFQLDEDLTCILIAHRLTTIRNCDRIYVMDQGKIVESGTYDELMALNGRFAALWAAQ